MEEKLSISNLRYKHIHLLMYTIKYTYGYNLLNKPRPFG